MRRPLVVGNWKMHGTRAEAKRLITDIQLGLESVSPATEVGVCVPFVLIPEVAEQLAAGPGNLLLGAQNVADHPVGPYTGEISALMLSEFDCKLAIVGHSSRRSLYCESDQLVAARYAQALAGGLRPILCIGESFEQREQDHTCDVIQLQLSAVLNSTGVESFARAVIAYEPVWAIGTGHAASPEQAQEVHAFIRQHIADYDAEIAANVQILYGGGLGPGTAQQLFDMPDIDGGLIGAAALEAASFVTICKAVDFSR